MRRILSAVAACLLLLGGCASEQDDNDAQQQPAPSPSANPQPPAQGQPAAAPASVDPSQPCGLLPDRAVGQVFSIREITATPQPPQTLDNGASVAQCEYRADVNGNSLGTLSVAVYEGNPISPDQMVSAIMQGKPGAERVEGVGEGAAYYMDETNNAAVLTAARVVDGTPILANYAGSPRASPDTLSDLVRHAIDAL